MKEAQFDQLAAEGYNRIPVTLETFADLDTPLSIYLKLANGPYTYLLESVQGGERFGRYSIIGLASPTRIVVNRQQVLVLTGDRIAERAENVNPLDFIGDYLARFRAAFPREHREWVEDNRRVTEGARAQLDAVSEARESAE